MTSRKRPLPTPPGRRFGPGEKRPGTGSGEPLIEERLARAAAMGKLEEFMETEFEGNEHARRLASMMMGMTGINPSVGTRRATGSSEEAQTGSAEGPPPEDVVQAAQAGDVGRLMSMLAREHEKRTGTQVGTAAGSAKPKTSRKKGAKKEPAAEEAAPGFDRDTLDTLVSISRENGVSIDWLIARAIKLYIRDYKTTGRI